MHQQAEQVFHGCLSGAFMLCFWHQESVFLSVLIVCDQIPEYFRVTIVCIYSVPFSYGRRSLFRSIMEMRGRDLC